MNKLEVHYHVHYQLPHMQEQGRVGLIIFDTTSSSLYARAMNKLEVLPSCTHLLSPLASYPQCLFCLMLLPHFSLPCVPKQDDTVTLVLIYTLSIIACIVTDGPRTWFPHRLSLLCQLICAVSLQDDFDYSWCLRDYCSLLFTSTCVPDLLKVDDSYLMWLLYLGYIFSISLLDCHSFK